VSQAERQQRREARERQQRIERAMAINAQRNRFRPNPISLSVKLMNEEIRREYQTQDRGHRTNT
jgi:tRNA (Thr-GGU) A37 N-methylase